MRFEFGDFDPDSYADAHELRVPIFVTIERAPERKPQKTAESVLHSSKRSKLLVSKPTSRRKKDVTDVDGPSVGLQLLKAGHVNELQIGMMPILLGKGQRLFEQLEGMLIMLKKTELVETGQRTDIWFTVQK